MLEDVHHEDGGHQSKEVGEAGGVEIGFGFAIQTVIEAEQQGDEDAGNHDVAEAEHGEVIGGEAVLEQVLGENNCKNNT